MICRGKLTRALWLLVAGVTCWLGPTLVRAAEEPTQRPSSILSHSRRFVVYGTTSSENLAWVSWLESAYFQFCDWLGHDLPFERDMPLRLVLVRDDAHAGVGRVVGEGVGYGRGADQRVLVFNVEHVSPLDVATALTPLLLDRFVPAAGGGGGGHEWPSWFVRGLAVQLLPDWRSHYFREGWADWVDGVLPSLSEVMRSSDDEPLSAEEVDPAVAVLLMQWLGAQKRNAAVVRGFWEGGVEPAYRVVWPEAGEFRELQQLFDLWLLSYEERTIDPLRLSLRDVLALKRALVVHARLSEDMPYRDAPDGLRPDEWIDYLGEPWVPLAARHMSLRIQMLGLGRPAPLREVTEKYGAYFNALSYPARRTRLGRFLYPTYSKRALRALLDEAEASLQALEGYVRALP